MSAAEILSMHHPTRGMAVAMGVTCACGYWTEGGRRRAGDDGLDAHRVDVIRAMPPEDLAELIGGRMESREHVEQNVKYARVVLLTDWRHEAIRESEAAPWTRPEETA